MGSPITTDAIFTQGDTQPESPWNEDDPYGIYHHAGKVLIVSMAAICYFLVNCISITISLQASCLVTYGSRTSIFLPLLISPHSINLKCLSTLLLSAFFLPWLCQRNLCQIAKRALNLTASTSRSNIHHNESLNWSLWQRNLSFYILTDKQIKCDHSSCTSFCFIVS